jgi:hypothetical protein
VSTQDKDDIIYSRELAFRSAEYMLRFLRNLGPIFEFDHENMIIALSVASSTVQHIIAAPESLAPYACLTVVIPPEQQRPVTRSAITQATGLPRETVRRKVASMIKSGLLISDPRGGIRIQPGILTTEAFIKAIAQNEADVRRLARQVQPLL